MFHIVLGVGLFILSVLTFWRVMRPGAGPPNLHIMLLAAVEAIGAFLFLIPGSVRLGATLLLLTLAVAFFMHARMGDWRIDLVIYAAGVWLVAARGDAREHG